MVRKIVEKTIWFTCIARNAIIVMICLLIAYLLDGPDLDPNAETTFKLTGTLLVQGDTSGCSQSLYSGPM